MSNQAIQSVRGMRDILPPVADQRLRLSQVVHQLLEQYGYHCADLPLLEKTALFQRTIGEDTDIVAKEMYTFLDRKQESLTLRPEATAGVVRAMIQNGLLQQPQKLFVEGAMFRYERPQKGRYRQFVQISVENFGVATPAVDVELIQIGHELFSLLHIRDLVELEINSLGLPEERKAYQQALVEYLDARRDQLDEDSLRRLETNPLRILDSKNPQVQACLREAPHLNDYLGEHSQAHFAEVKTLLQALGISYRVNPNLVRGLDYYCHTVFEWTTTELGAQGTICAGGRYDGLVEQLGGKPTPAAGFAFGVERILLLAENRHDLFKLKTPDVYVLIASAQEQAMAMQWASALRRATPGLVVTLHNEYASLKSQFKKADASGARYALVFASQERESGEATLKDLTSGEQQTLTLALLQTQLQNMTKEHDNNG